MKLAPALGFIALSSLVLAQSAPPAAPVREVVDTYFGQKVADPYRWMEDLKNPETSQWIKAEADYTRAYLDRVPLRQELLKRLGQLSDAGVRVSGIQRAGNVFFYYRRAPNENDRSVYVREGLSGAERRLIDPEKLSSAEKRYSINSYGSSDDGRFVSFVISAGGSENGELRVIESATGRETGDRIDRARFGAGAWLPDGKSFLFNRLQKLPDGAARTELYQRSRVYLHTLDTGPDTDKPVLGYDLQPTVKLTPTEIPFAYVPIGSRYAIGEVNAGVSPNSKYYIAPADALGQTLIPWRAVASLDDQVASLDLHGDELYVLTFKDTPRYKVLRTSAANPDLATAATVFPSSEAVVTGMVAAKMRSTCRRSTAGWGASGAWTIATAVANP